MRWMGIVMLSAGLLLGCEEQEAEQETPEPSEPASAEQESASDEVAAADPAPAPTPPPEALPVPSDFEGEMQKSITEKNYRAELNDLEKALESEEGAK